MAETTVATHTPSHQFVKSGNVFGNDAVDRGITAEIKGVQYGGLRFGSGGVDGDGLLRISTEHGELQLQLGPGERGFPGDFRFVLQIQGDVNEFLSDESLDLIEQFEFTVQYAQDHVAKAQFSVNLIDVVYSGEHFLSEGLPADEVLPSALLEPVSTISAVAQDAAVSQQQHSYNAETGALQLSAGDLLPGRSEETLDLDRYFGGDTEPVSAQRAADTHDVHLVAGVETTGLDELPKGDLPPVDG